MAIERGAFPSCLPHKRHRAGRAVASQHRALRWLFDIVALIGSEPSTRPASAPGAAQELQRISFVALSRLAGASGCRDCASDAPVGEEARGFGRGLRCCISRPHVTARLRSGAGGQPPPCKRRRVVAPSPGVRAVSVGTMWFPSSSDPSVIASLRSEKQSGYQCRCDDEGGPLFPSLLGLLGSVLVSSQAGIKLRRHQLPPQSRASV